MEFSKKPFLEQCLIKQRELGKRQREYKQLIHAKLATRAENIVEASSQNKLLLSKLEKDELKAQLWTSVGVLYKNSDERHLKEINCHIECQEYLYKDMNRIKTEITNTQSEINRVSRQIYDINCKIVPDTMYHLHVAKSRKKMQILENQLEVGMRRECIFTALNAKLRDNLTDQMHYRQYFDDSYTKMVEKLNAEKKYINDLIEFVLIMYENSIDICEKIENHRRDIRKKDLMYADMVNVLRQEESIYLDETHFHTLKTQERCLEDLQPKEYKRRDRMRQLCGNKIELYTKVLEKIMEYTDTNSCASVIDKFKEQESVYYSYFNYANEMSYHMTLLNNSVNRLTDNIIFLGKVNVGEHEKQIVQVEVLEESLEKKLKNNEEMLAQKNIHDERIKNLLEGIEGIFHLIRVDATPLKLLLGDHTVVDLVNVRQFLKMIEQRISDIAAIYYMKCQEDSKQTHYTPQICEITPLDEIVLAQQCPECAEGEAINDVDEGAVVILEKDEFKKRLYEKINQPEMQYRLHSILNCKLPRSRTLASK